MSWNDTFAIATAFAFVLLVAREAALHRWEPRGATRRVVALRIATFVAGVVLIAAGSSLRVQPLEVVGTSLALASVAVAIANGVARVAKRPLPVLVAGLVTVGVGAYVIHESMASVAWCAENGSWSTLATCIAASGFELVGWAAASLGSVLLLAALVRMGGAAVRSRMDRPCRTHLGA
jgi:hypothetical protein